MSDIKILAEEFYEIRHHTGCNDTAAAILILADAIRDSATFSRSNAENFGHELALALKNVLSESTISVSGEIETSER